MRRIIHDLLGRDRVLRRTAISLAPVNTVAPAITGTLREGQILTVSNGTWTNTPTGYAYQWKRNGTNIGTNAATYTLVTADVGANITCTVTASNANGSGLAASAAVGPILPLAPTNSVAPVIGGTATQGQILTVTSNGTWTGSPTSYAYQWKRGGVAISGETGSTYLLGAADVGASITCAVAATNAGGSATATSNALGPVAALGSGTNLTVSNVSATGAAPLVLQVSSDAALPAGIRFQWEFDDSLTPAKNGDGSYATPTQTGVTFVDGDSYARLDLALGYVTPSGAFAFHMRGLVDDEAGAITIGGANYTAVTNWSNDYADTIGGSVAVLATSNGADKDQWVTVSGTPALTYAGTDTIGAAQGVRATSAASSAKFQFEVTINAVKASSYQCVGICNTTDNFNDGTYPNPGFTNANGISVLLNASGTVAVFWNSAGTEFDFTNTAGSVAVGDIFTFIWDMTAHTLDVYRTRSGTTVKLGGQATGLPAIASPHAFAAPRNNEGGTFNFGGSAFARALDTGVTIYG